MRSAGKQAITERTMIFELWGNIGLRKGDYKLWADVGRDATPDWNALITEIENEDLALFNLREDVGEQNDLRTQKPDVYASLKAELIDYFSGINAEYPVPERAGAAPKKSTEAKPKTKPKAKAGGPISERLFKARDTNKDGALTLREYADKPVEEAPGRTKVFNKLDANGDGKLTLEEVKKAEQ